MAKKITTQKFIAPKKGDKLDRRCAFVTKFDEPDAHSKVDMGSWCFGCDYYVCQECEHRDITEVGAHQLADHDSDEGDDFQRKS